MKYTQKHINKLLTEDGRTISDYFLVEDSIMYISEWRGRRSFMVFDLWDDPLMQACIKYLKKKRIRQFASWAEFEKWYGKPLDGEEVFLKSLIMDGQGRKKEAFALCRKAVKLGYDGAQLNLGNYYSDGTGTKKNINKGLYWYKRDWRTGKQTGACSNIALTYASIGNDRQAEFWWKKAVEKNDGDAALELAQFYLSRGKKDNETIIALLNKVGRTKHVTEAAKEDALILLRDMTAGMKK